MSASIQALGKSKVKELIYIHGRDTLAEDDMSAINKCLELTTHLWAGMVDGEFVCTWGLIPPTLLSTEAYLWLYCTEAIKDHEFIFVRWSQKAVEEMLERYPLLVGLASVDNARGIRWLKWLGAKFGVPQGKAIPFQIRKKRDDAARYG